MMTLTPAQSEEVRIMRGHFPYRLIYVAVSPSGESVVSAVPTMRVPNKLAREGWTVVMITNGADR
jgi:hypothetical protein